MKCIECKGTGEAPNQNYRTSQAKVQTKLEPKLPFWKKIHVPKLEKFKWQNWPQDLQIASIVVGFFGTLASIIAAIILITNHVHDKHMVIAQRNWEPYVNKMGYVVVQYDSNIDPTFHPIRCWVVKPEKKESVEHYSYMEPEFPIRIDRNPNFKTLEIGDVNDPNGFIIQMGVKDPSTCVHL